MTVAAQPRARRFWPTSVFILAIVTILGALICAARRGGWADEYSTIYFADPSTPFGIAWAHIWPTETNPPFFYLFARLWEMLTGPTLLARRLINLIPLAFATLWFIVAWQRYPQFRRLLTCLIFFGVSSQYLLWFFPEYRSYFWQFCTGLVFLGSFALSYLNRDRGLDPFQLIALPFLIDLHEVTALYTAVLLLVIFAVEISRGNYLRAAALVVVTALSLIPLALFLDLELSNSQTVLTKVSWIKKQGPVGAIVSILKFMFLDLGHNLVALLLGLAVLALPSLRPKDDFARLIGLISLAALIATVLILGVNHFSPITINRYFSLMGIEVILIISVAISPYLAEQPILAGLVLLNALFYLATSFHRVETARRWEEVGPVLARIVAQCPATRIHAGSNPPVFGPDIAITIGPIAAEKVALQNIAALYHLHLLPLSPDSPQTCPVIYWTEYRGPTKADIQRDHGDVASAANDSAGFGLSAQALLHATAIKTPGSPFGVILIEAPSQ